jgi:hypothetical protein
VSYATVSLRFFVFYFCCFRDVIYELEPLFEDRDPMEIKEGEFCCCDDSCDIFRLLILLFV